MINRLIFALIFMFCQLFSFAQDKPTNRFEASFAYGAAYALFGGESNNPWINLELPSVHHAYEFSFDFRLRHNRFIGITYARHEVWATIDDYYYYQHQEVYVVMDGYRHFAISEFIGVNFRREITPNFNMAVGLFVTLMQRNTIRLSQRAGDPNMYIIFEDDFPRLVDNELGLWAAVEYFVPVRDYFDIGIRSRGFVSLSGFEKITLTPVLKLGF